VIPSFANRNWRLGSRKRDVRIGFGTTIGGKLETPLGIVPPVVRRVSRKPDPQRP
jgi:hypothetical protein